MHRSIPMANKLCFQRNLERDMDIHREKIKNIKCSVDKTQPKAYQFLSTSNKNKTAQSLARNDEIERENNILLRKITNIMQQGSGDLVGIPQPPQSQMRRSQTSTVLSKKPKSLNIEIRKRELVKIVIENQAILKRIQKKKSAYNVKDWNNQRKTVEKYINNKCEYQYKNYKPTNTQVKFGQWESKSPNQGTQMSSTRKNFTGKLKPLHTRGVKNIFSTTRKIGMDSYFIDVKVSKGVFSIVLDNIEKANHRYTIELLEKEGLAIWKKECHSKQELLLERIRVDERSKTVFFRRINDNVSISRDKIENHSERESLHQNQQQIPKRPQKAEGSRQQQNQEQQQQQDETEELQYEQQQQQNAQRSRSKSPENNNNNQIKEEEPQQEQGSIQQQEQVNKSVDKSLNKSTENKDSAQQQQQQKEEEEVEQKPQESPVKQQEDKQEEQEQQEQKQQQDQTQEQTEVQAKEKENEPQQEQAVEDAQKESEEKQQKVEENVQEKEKQVEEEEEQNKQVKEDDHCHDDDGNKQQEQQQENKEQQE